MKRYKSKVPLKCAEITVSPLNVLKSMFVALLICQNKKCRARVPTHFEL